MQSQAAQINGNNNLGFSLNGDLTFQTFNAVWQPGCDQIQQCQSPVHIDLSGVTRCDSAGVAMIIDWFRAAKKMNKDIILLQIPAQMQAIVKVSGLTKLFPEQS